jgi:hypothetical protein
MLRRCFSFRFKLKLMKTLNTGLIIWKIPLLEFRIHGDCSAEFVEAQLDWDVFTTQLECIYHLQGEERHNTVLVRNKLVTSSKDGSKGMVQSHCIMNYSTHTHG